MFPIYLLFHYLKLFLLPFQAKALAEKNMRDLLAQREQAERSVCILLMTNAITLLCLLSYIEIPVHLLQRLAETLDAEVRRWSSGKEGNLRALLSTLQYVGASIPILFMCTMNNCFLLASVVSFWIVFLGAVPVVYLQWYWKRNVGLCPEL
jgi:hypothetical protein